MTSLVLPVVAIDGATGYLGNHLASRLISSGYKVRCIVHAGANQRDIDFLQSIGASIFTASLEKADQRLDEALSGCDVAVHLIGSIAPKKGERLEDLHGRQTANLVSAAKHNSISKLIIVTALGTAGDASSSYHQTKWQAEENVRSSGLNFVIVRPSLIIGRQVGSRDSKLIARYIELIRSRPAVPVLGGGSNKIQPVFVGDLTTAIEKFIESDRYDGKTLEIGGLQVLTMKEFVEKLIALQGANKKIKAIPWFAAKLAATICEAVQDVPMVSRDQIKLSGQDNVCSSNALTNQLHMHPMSVDAALATYKATAPTPPHPARSKH